MRLRDKSWDIFELTEYMLNFFEKSSTQLLSSFMLPETPIASREYVKVYLRADTKKRIYKREDYDLVTYLGDIGGLMDFVMLFGWFISTHFVSRLLYASLIK